MKKNPCRLSGSDMMYIGKANTNGQSMSGVSTLW